MITDVVGINKPQLKLYDGGYLHRSSIPDIDRCFPGIVVTVVCIGIHFQGQFITRNGIVARDFLVTAHVVQQYIEDGIPFIIIVYGTGRKAGKLAERGDAKAGKMYLDYISCNCQVTRLSHVIYPIAGCIAPDLHKERKITDVEGKQGFRKINRITIV